MASGSLGLIFIPAFVGAFMAGIILRWLGLPLRLKPLAMCAASWYLGVVMYFLVMATGIGTPGLGAGAGALVGGFGTCLTLKYSGIQLKTWVIMQSSLAWAASFGVITGYLAGINLHGQEFAVAGLLTVAGTTGSIPLVYGLGREHLQRLRRGTITDNPGQS